jgi:DNA polymerase-1
MHYTINTCRARTSRQSVTDPPMQTFDRDEPVIRGSFIPRPGHRLVTIDADQIEMRLAAHFSADKNLIADFLEAERNGESFFVLASARIFGHPVSKKDPRYTHTKNASYGQIYGAGLERAAATAGVPVEHMRPIYMGFQQRYPGVSQLMNRLIYQGKHGGRPHAVTIDGRNLYVNRGHEYAILNTMVQGSAAVILKRGEVDLDAHGFGPYMRLTIHDEFLFEFPEDIAEQGLREATRILTDRDNYRVPITWGGKVLEGRWVKT